MNRRNFIGTLVGGLAASAAVRTWPFRVFSFPSKPVWPPGRFDYLDMSLWGRNYTPAEVNAAGFGLSIPENAKIISIALDLEKIGPKIPTIFLMEFPLNLPDLQHLEAEFDPLLDR
jgi:hypothetical protein